MWTHNRSSYEIKLHCANSLGFGLPQDHERVYIVGVHRGRCPNGPPLQMPAMKSPATNFLEFLGNPVACRPGSLPAHGPTRKQVLVAQSHIRQRLRVNPSAVTAVVDCGPARMNVAPTIRLNVAPAIQCCGGDEAGFWVTCLGRYLSVWELLNLQGVSAKDMDFSCLSEQEIGRMVGNAIPATPSDTAARACKHVASSIARCRLAVAHTTPLRCPSSRHTSDRHCGLRTSRTQFESAVGRARVGRLGAGRLGANSVYVFGQRQG